MLPGGGECGVNLRVLTKICMIAVLMWLFLNVIAVVCGKVVVVGGSERSLVVVVGCRETGSDWKVGLLLKQARNLLSGG